MPTERSRILRLALPAVVNNISLTLMQTVDMVFVGGLGPEALGAVGTMGTLIWAIMTLVDGLATGITAVVARHVGAQDWEGAQTAGRTGLVAALGLALFLTPFLIVGREELLKLISLPHELWEPSEAYFHVFLWFLPLAFTRNAVDAVHRAGGAAVAPTLITVLSNLINISLDPLLIYGGWGLPALGTGGAALATGIATVVALGVQSGLLHGTRWSPFGGTVVSRREARTIIDIGFPSTLEQGAMAISQNLIIAWAVNPLGALSAASFQITMRLSSLSFTPAFGFGMAAIVLVGQALGAQNRQLARNLGWKTTWYAVGTLLALSVVYWWFAAPLATLFTADARVIELSVWPLRIYALTMGFLGATMVLAPALRGAGDTRYTLRTMVVSRFGVRLPLAWLLGIGMGWGLNGVWMGMGADFIVRGVLLGARFSGSAWENKITYGERPP